MDVILWIVFAAWALSLIQTILNLAFIRTIRPAKLAREPRVSVIIPARDEEQAIERTVRAFLAQTYGAFEVIVVDDGSTDGTPDILRRIEQEDSRLTVVRGVEPPSGWLGKPWALHQGSLRAGGEMLLFVDADIVYAPEALNAAVAEMQRSRAAMIALLPYMEMRGVGENAVIPQLTMICFTQLPIWLTDRLSISRLAIGGGTGNLIRRAEYETIGGHVALSGAVIDDVGLARHVRQNGHRTFVVRADRLIRVRMYHGLSESVRGFTKNAFSTMERSYVVALISIAFLATLQLLPFAAALTGNTIAVGCVALILTTRIVLFTALRYPIWSAVLLQPVQGALWISIILRSVWVTGIRQKVIWRGRSYDSAKTRFGARR